MFKNIVVAVDGSKSSFRAVDMATEMARLAEDEIQIMILTVYKHVSTL
ncbi:MAG: universal stress protein, partial [bacterium]